MAILGSSADARRAAMFTAPARGSAVVTRCADWSEDCDIVREPAHEPTVLLAPLVLVALGEWHDLSRNEYSPRRYAYPGGRFSNVPDGSALAVDLAWATSVLKGSLRAPSVSVVRALPSRPPGLPVLWLAVALGYLIGRAVFARLDLARYERAAWAPWSPQQWSPSSPPPWGSSSRTRHWHNL